MTEECTCPARDPSIDMWACLVPVQKSIAVICLLRSRISISFGPWAGTSCPSRLKDQAGQTPRPDIKYFRTAPTTPRYISTDLFKTQRQTRRPPYSSCVQPCCFDTGAYSSRCFSQGAIHIASAEGLALHFFLHSTLLQCQPSALRPVC
jgi:hypothetical protein